MFGTLAVEDGFHRSVELLVLPLDVLLVGDHGIHEALEVMRSGGTTAVSHNRRHC